MGEAGLPRSLQESLDSTKVSYAQLGASGLKVSIPILGAMSFGNFFPSLRSFCLSATFALIELVLTFV
jgi:hypothetical protein